ncbi:hypothetical protein [Pseudomonas putida]|uniref:Uncharacterized protein n=1 Tax=Pseudomonas putida TaxID=303 RepID=A0AAW5HSQ4_PSEPU|nr:hypothetical protein [Pseudomonas putida]MCO1623552.1 hypothetical protein [Pseudomonas putida]
MHNRSDGGCTQAANAMQQRKEGATIFLLQVAPASAFSDKTHFLLLSGVKNRFFRINHTKKAPFQGTGMAIGRVAPSTQKIQVAPSCTRIVLQLLLMPA